MRIDSASQPHRLLHQNQFPVDRQRILRKGGGRHIASRRKHLIFNQRMFLWASYVGGKDIDEVWSPADLVNGHKRRPECRNILCGALTPSLIEAYIKASSIR
jgi:hypothetical protein